MEKQELINFTEEAVNDLLQDTLFLVEIKVKPTNNIKVYLDDDNGVDIGTCTMINRALYKKIEEAGIFPDGNYSLEVSSPGLGEPLKLHRQYVKNIGRNVEVVLNDGRTAEGEMTEVTDEGIAVNVETGKGRKKETVKTEIAFADIKQTTVTIKF